MRVFALVELGERQAVDVYVRREDAYAALDKVHSAEPEWMTFHVVPIELDERELSMN